MLVGVIGTYPNDAAEGVECATVGNEGGDLGWKVWEVTTDWWAFGPVFGLDVDY